MTQTISLSPLPCLLQALLPTPLGVKKKKNKKPPSIKAGVKKQQEEEKRYERILMQDTFAWEVLCLPLKSRGDFLQQLSTELSTYFHINSHYYKTLQLSSAMVCLFLFEFSPVS